MPHLVADPAFAHLKAFVVAATGLAYYANRDNDLAQRAERRMQQVGVTDCATYLAMLQKEAADTGELNALILELTIGETYFFRHQELFDALEKVVLPDLIEKNQHSRRLRIWSAGCATGPEPYSLSILLKKNLKHLTAGWQIDILGTDINQAFLARAKEGVFEDWVLRSTPDHLRQACFSRSGKSWEILPVYREGVSFCYFNLVSQPFPSLLNDLSAFDLVLCRNVMIYFDKDIIARLVQQFYQCLVDGGWLVVGHAESSIDLFRAFSTVNATGATLYQKSQTGQHTKNLPRSLQLEPPQAFQNAAPAGHIPLSKTDTNSMPQKTRLPEKLAGPGSSSESAASPTLADIRLLASCGQYEEALAHCQKLRDEDKLNPRFYFYQSMVLDHLGKHDETEQALRRAIYLDRHFVLAHFYLGVFLQKKNDHQAASRAFQNVLSLLSKKDGHEVVDADEEIGADDLEKLTRMHLEVLQHGSKSH